MWAQLMVIDGPDKGRVFRFGPDSPLLIGRSRATETRLTDPQVSRVHCQAEFFGASAVVTDFESVGGTHVNGRRVEQAPLSPGDVIQVGATRLQFVCPDPTEEGTVPPPAAPAAAPPPTAVPPEELTVLAHFDLGPVVARGRSGVVFHAHDTRGGGRVALKVLRPEAGGDEDKQRFVRTMRTVLPLRHPNLVEVYGAGKSGPYCWAAMEFVEGESLTEVIRRAGVAGMLDWTHAFRVALQIGQALDYAHRRHIVHRNVTPHNILIEAATRRAKLGDLMLAKALEGPLAQHLTRPGELLGDVRYLSPEQTRGAYEVGPRSDLFSLGATVYHLLAGRPPFEGASPAETLTLIRGAEWVPPTRYQLAIPGTFVGVVKRLLAGRPEDRVPSAVDLVAELHRVAKYQRLTV